MSPSHAQASGARFRTSFHSGCERFGRLQEPKASVKVLGGGLTSTPTSPGASARLVPTSALRGAGSARRGEGEREHPVETRPVKPSFKASLRPKCMGKTRDRQ